MLKASLLSSSNILLLNIRATGEDQMPTPTTASSIINKKQIYFLDRHTLLGCSLGSLECHSSFNLQATAAEVSRISMFKLFLFYPTTTDRGLLEPCPHHYPFYPNQYLLPK